MRPRRTHLIYVAVVAALLAATFFALLGDGRSGFWVDHPMLGALVSGLILFAFGALVIQRVVDHRAAERWKVIARVAYWTLGVEIREALATLWGIHSGPDVSSSQPGGEWVWEELTPARELKTDLPGKAHVARFNDPALPSHDLREGEILPRARLAVLLTDREWVSFAKDHLAMRSEAMRAALREWSSLMIWASRPRELVDDFADLLREVSRVLAALQQVAYNADNDRVGAAERWREATIARWQVTDLKARVLVNEFWAEAGSKYRFLLPPELRGRSHREVFREPGTLGRSWGPLERDLEEEVN